MFLRPFATRVAHIAALLALLIPGGLLHAQDSNDRGRKYKAPPPTARVEVTVIRATNGKPVENAAVIFHPLANGKDNGNMELKTNDEGKAVIDLLNLNSDVRLQVIAPGFQTYGEDWKIDKDTMSIEVKLNRPAAQYSVYKHNEGKQPDAADPAAKPAPKADEPKQDESVKSTAGAKDDSAAAAKDPKDAAADAKPAKDKTKSEDPATSQPPQ